MKNFIVLDEDMLFFEPQFAHRIVTPTEPAMIRGSGHATINGRRVCVMGDEKKVQVQATYRVPGHTPGTGMLTIMSLMPDQQALRCRSRAGLILKGQQFIARFTQLLPAMSTAPTPVPDPPTPGIGKGRFITTQLLASVG